MKIIFSILLLSLHVCIAQVNQIAVITNPEIGPQSNAMNLIEVVDNINKRNNIIQVAVIGNLTANGKIDEFIWAQEILDELIVPYFVVGGENDYRQSESAGSEISLLWGDDKHFYSNQNFSLAGLNTLLITYPDKKYVDAESLTWINEKLNSSQASRLMTFSYYPVQSAENSNQFFEPLLKTKLFSFVGKADKSFLGNSIFEGLYLNRKDGWGYLLVSIKKDSIQIEKLLSEEIKKKIKPEIVKLIFSKPLVRESKEPVHFVAAGSKVWTYEKNKITIVPSMIDSKNIYSVSRNGLVLCLDYSGKEIWHFESNEKISIAPCIESDLLVVASDDGDIITINKTNGSPHQIIGIGEEITSGISVIDTKEQGKITKSVVAGTIFGNLFCYDLFSLDPIWTEQISEMNSETYIISMIVSSDNKIFFYDNQGTLYCRSAANGMLIWKIDASEGGWKVFSQSAFSPNKNSLIVKEKDLILVDDSGNLFCIDALLGNVKWNIRNLNANKFIRINSKGELILSTTKNKIILVSTKLGKVTSEIDLTTVKNNAVITDIEAFGANIIISFSDGWVYKINVKQKAEKYFRGSFAPVISLTEINDNCLVTDYDGKLTLLK